MGAGKNIPMSGDAAERMQMRAAARERMGGAPTPPGDGGAFERLLRGKRQQAKQMQARAERRNRKGSV